MINECRTTWLAYYRSGRVISARKFMRVSHSIRMGNHLSLMLILLLELLLSSASGGSLQSQSEPVPSNAVQGIIKAFDQFPVVAIGELHGRREDKDFLISLIKSPEFSVKVNDIAVEFGNALYQPVLDRYIAGDPVPIMELREVWRNTTVLTGVWDAPIYQRFFADVRDVNQALPRSRRLRVLAGDPPIDWSRIHDLADATPFLGARDTYFASMIEKEVLARGRRALIVMGGFHFYRRSQTGQIQKDTVGALIKQRHPGSTFVILTHAANRKGYEVLEARLSSWKIPSLYPLRGTWLGAVDASYQFPPTRTPVGGGKAVKQEVPIPAALVRLQHLADAFLYLGPTGTFTSSRPLPGTYDPGYLRELDRRYKVIYGIPLDPKTLTQ